MQKKTIFGYFDSNHISYYVNHFRCSFNAQISMANDCTVYNTKKNCPTFKLIKRKFAHFKANWRTLRFLQCQVGQPPTSSILISEIYKFGYLSKVYHILRMYRNYHRVLSNLDIVSAII